MVNQSADAGVNEGLGAVDAREMGDIAGAAARRNAMQSSLDDRVRLGVDRADAVPVDHQVPDLIAVRLAGWRTVEPGGQDAFVEHEDTADEGAVAGAAFGDGVGNFHEVGIPIGAHSKFSLK